MRNNYRIYGYNLQLDFVNDLKLLNCFEEFVGRIVSNDSLDIIGRFVFKKKSSEFLEQYYRNMEIDMHDVRKVYVQPTGESAKVFVDDKQNKTTHYYMH